MSDHGSIASSDDEQSTTSSSSTSGSESDDERLEKDPEIETVKDPEQAASTVSEEGIDSPDVKSPMLALLEPTEGQYDIVLVHGLHGDQQNSWASPTEEDGKPTWLTEGLAGNPPVARIYSFGYSLKLDSLNKSPMAAIHDLADSLINELFQKVKDDPEDPFRPVVFITHDIGGIIVKEALRIALLEKINYTWFTIYTRALVFFGCPHQSIYDGNMANQLLPLVFQNGVSSHDVRMEDITALGEGIEELNSTFVGLQASLSVEIINIYSNHSADQIFDQMTATIGLPYEIPLASSKSHGDLCRLRKEDAVYHKIQDRISGSAKESFCEAVRFSDWWSYMIPMAPPLYPSRWLSRAFNPYAWITSHSTLKAWLVPRRSARVYLHGSVASHLAGDQVLSHVRDKVKSDDPSKHMIIYFQFDSRDDRLATYTGLLKSLIAQLLRHSASMMTPISALLERMINFRTCTEAELLQCYRQLVTYADDKTVWCIITNAKDCGLPLTRFVAIVDELFTANECCAKYAIVTQNFVTHNALRQSLSEWPTIDLDNPSHSILHETRKANREAALQDIVRQYPFLRGTSRRTQETTLDSNNDLDWGEFVLGRLRRRKGPVSSSEVQDAINLLSSDLQARQNATSSIVGSLRAQEEKWDLAGEILLWVNRTLRPLTVWELRRAISISSASHAETEISRETIKELFDGLLVVKYQEVHLAHPQLSRALKVLEPNSGSTVASTKILIGCLTYLSSIGFEKWKEGPKRWSTPELQDARFSNTEFNFADYAALYLEQHFGSVVVTEAIRSHVKKILTDPLAYRRIAVARWAASNLFERPDRSHALVLPFMVGMRLHTWVLENPTSFPEEYTNNMNTLVSAAWEAARYRQRDQLKAILSHCTLNDAQKHDILWAANWSADEEVINLVVSYIIRSTSSGSPFEWPDFILIRAATLNSTRLLAKLLDAGAALHGTYEYEGDIYLHSAVFWSAAAGYLDSLKFFLGRGAIAGRLYSRRRQLLHIASAHGHVGAVRLLLAAGADINALGGDDGQSALCRACQWGYYNVVQELVKHSELELDKHGDVRWTPLAAAADQGYVQSVRLLLKSGADPNVLGSVNWSPLQFAINKGHDHITKLLLEHGANPHVTTNEVVPLPEAAGAGKLELVKLLVEAGHPVDALGSYNRTALLRAAYSGHVEVADYLIGKGAQATLSDQGNSNGLHLAAERGHAEIIRLLCDHGANLNQISEAGWTPLHIGYSQPQATRALLEKGANPNIVAWNWTPLALSATYDQTENVRTLLEFGPDLEVQYGDDPYNGYTALGCAVKKERVDSVRLLLEAGANVNPQGSKGQTPLHDAVRLDNPALVQLLLEFRPDVNHAQQEGFTPLMYISPTTRIETVRPLINAGADLEARNRKGLTVLMCAVGHENAALVKYLLARGAQLNTVGSIRGGPLHYACWDSSLEMVKLLVDAGADINLVDPQSGSPLHQAGYRGPFGEWEHQSKICNYLLSLEQLDVNRIGSMRGSLLSWICVTAPLVIATALLDKGARVDQPDIQGRTAMHLAAANSVGHVDLIFEQGGDIEARDHVGRTVLHFAMLSGSTALVERVLSLSRELLDVPDDDGWTPLLWAARGWNRLSRSTTASVHEEIISMLLNRGANPCTQWVGLGRTWSAAKIARYHGHSDSVVRLLEDAYQSAHPQADALENVGIHFSRVAASFNGTCDGCFMSLYGYRHKCQVCFDFDFCYKCFLTKHKTHDGHAFSSTSAEEEYVAEPEGEGEGNGDGDASSTTHGSSSDVAESEGSDSDKDSDGESSDSD